MIRNQMENKIREKRDREIITFIHTGGQTGPRWRASLGKSGPMIPVFLSSIFTYTYIYIYTHTYIYIFPIPLVLFHFSSSEWTPTPLSSKRNHAEKSEIVSKFHVPLASNRSNPRRFFLFFFQKNNGKHETGRFGPIGPETAQCQLPHRVIVTHVLGMVRAGG